MHESAAWPQPRAAYVHVPFCAHRCGYCNFTIVVGHDELTERYLQAIELELRRLEAPREVDTLYIGGGTPTYLSPADLSRLLRLVRHWFPPTAAAEFTIEANPVDLTQPRVDVLREFGVNRISLGVQSFQSRKLAVLEREHSPEEIARSFELARRCAASVSIDLIFAAPDETVDEWAADLAAATALAPDHLSTYGLTFERGTPFWSRLERGRLTAVDETAEREMYELAIGHLQSAGYEHYEVSNFAQPGHLSRHNRVYWRGDSYFAVGPGAARYVAGRRECNHRSTWTYLERMLAGRSPVAESEELAPEDRAREALVFGPRRMEGIERVRFEDRFGFDLEALVGDALHDAIRRGLLVQANGRLRLTREGLLISDSIWPTFLRV